MRKVTCGVIGAGGYLGRQLAAFIEIRKIPIEIIVFSRENRRFAIPESDGQLEKIDVLLNLGSPNEVVARQGGGGEHALISWTECFFAAVRQASPARCVHVSTFHIFGSPTGLVNEYLPMSGGNVYGDIHLKCLRYVEEVCHKEGVALTTIIPTNIYGTVSVELCPRNDLIINLALQKLLKREVLRLNSDGNGLRDFLWIEDVLDALCRFILHSQFQSNGMFIVASEKTLSVRDALNFLFQEFGEGKLDECYKWGAMTDQVVPFAVSSSKLKSVIGDWRPKMLPEATQIQKMILTNL